MAVTFQWQQFSTERKQAYVLGLIAAAIAALLLVVPGRESWHAAGPANVGHERTACTACHTRAPGNVVGQAFSNLMYAVGVAESAPYFIFEPAGTEQCLACHDNPDDRHPVADFTEPEFATARAEAGVHSCLGCHQQHLGTRASVTPRVCRYCHEDTAIDDDPVDVPHTDLIVQERWDTCLGCHDFHGNHDRTVPTRMSEALPEAVIQRYLDGGASPYGPRRLTAIQTMRRER
jgi:hypothetical protein